LGLLEFITDLRLLLLSYEVFLAAFSIKSIICCLAFFDSGKFPRFALPTTFLFSATLFFAVQAIQNVTTGAFTM
jgi:hypothetical protein